MLASMQRSATLIGYDPSAAVNVESIDLAIANETFHSMFGTARLYCYFVIVLALCDFGGGGINKTLGSRALMLLCCLGCSHELSAHPCVILEVAESTKRWALPNKTERAKSLLRNCVNWGLLCSSANDVTISILPTVRRGGIIALN